MIEQSDFGDHLPMTAFYPSLTDAMQAATCHDAAMIRIVTVDDGTVN